MIVNNTQANIFKVNGGLADNFANRPAASGSFYIFYSIDTQEIYYDNGAWVLLGGAGSATNIYNSDGILTGNRILDGNDNSLQFINTGFTSFDSFFGFAIASNRNNAYINMVTFGSGNDHELNILKNNYIQLLARDQNNNTLTIFRTDNNIIKSLYQNNDIGLKLDFANNLYQFGQITGGNQSLIEIDDTRPRIGTKFFGSSFNDGFDIVGNEYVRLGFNSSINKVQMLLSETGNEITTSDINGTNGFRLDFNNQNFKFGYFVIPTNLWFEVDNTTKIIKTINNQNNNGLKLDFAQRRYQLGQINGNNNTTFVIEDVQGGIFCLYQNIGIGFAFQGNASIYKYGQINGGNQTIFTIADGATYPIQLEGTNITSGTSGGVSGQHLKIKLNGVDYKIELRNP